MKGRPKIGAQAELRFAVAAEHAIDFARNGMPAVLSTPTLVGFLERTAREVMLPLLDANERTVGIEIEVRHLAPTPVGQSVTCIARVIQVESTQATFQVEARDEQEIIARGLHKRQVIRVEPFAHRVARKAASTS